MPQLTAADCIDGQITQPNGIALMAFRGHIQNLIAMVAIIASTSTAAESPMPPHSQPLDSGFTVYQQHCASCHGAKGEGAPNSNTLDSKGELPAPSHGVDGHTWRHPDAQLYRMISLGWRDPFNKTPRLTMPAFKEVLTPKEIKAVIDYLKTLWSDRQKQFQIQENQRRGKTE